MTRQQTTLQVLKDLVDPLDAGVASIELTVARQEAARRLVALRGAELYVSELRDQFNAARKIVTRLKKRESRIRTGRN